MAGKSGGNKMTKKKSGKSTRARKSDAPVVEENVELISDGNNSDDLPEHPSENKRSKRKRPSTGGGVSSRTRARKAVSCGNESIGEEAVQQVSAPVRDMTVISRSVDGESEDMSAVSSKERLIHILLGKRCRGYKVMAVKGGITRAERLAKMKAQATTKKRGRPN